MSVNCLGRYIPLKSVYYVISLILCIFSAGSPFSAQGVDPGTAGRFD